MNDEYISRDDAKNALLNKGQHTTRYRLGETWELNFMEILEALDTIPTADVQPLSAVAEHIKNRLYETALNTQNEEASKTIEAMAERIDFWINELKDGETND